MPTIQDEIIEFWRDVMTDQCQKFDNRMAAAKELMKILDNERMNHLNEDAEVNWGPYDGGRDDD